MTRREQLDNQIAAMLHAGATYEHVITALGVGQERVGRVRRERGIPVPPGRRALTSDERRTREERATAMLRAGATYQQIYDVTRLQFERISALRKQHRIPVPSRRPPRDIDALCDQILGPGATP